MAYTPALVNFPDTFHRLQQPTGTIGMPATFSYLLVSFWVCLGTDADHGGHSFYFSGQGIGISPSHPIIPPDSIFLNFGIGVSPPWWHGTNTCPLNGSISNILVSVDGPGGTVQCYVNDVATSIISGGLTGQPVGAFNWPSPDFTWEGTGATPVGAGLGDFFMAAPASFFDLTNVSNRRKFINSDGSPVDLGADASSVLGTPPPVYLTSRNGTANDIATNYGTGGSVPIIGSGFNFQPAGSCNIPWPPPAPPFGPPEGYLEFITCCDRAIMGHLYQFTSATGIEDYFTDLDIDINYNGVIWKSGALRFEGLQRKLGIGATVDEQTMKIWSSPTDTLFGANFLSGVHEGLLNGAKIVRRRIVWEFVSGNAAIDVLNPPLFAWTLFTGYTSTIMKGGISHVEMKVKSALWKLSINMPRNYYQPGCLWTLFDQGCQLNKASFATNFVVTAATASVITVININPSLGADNIPYYAQGRMLFTSGANNGLQVLIDDNSANTFTLAYPLDSIPAVGDTFTAYPGCSKSYGTCTAKFNNGARFRGFDKVPPVVVSV